MMPDKKISVSDLRAEAERLVASGKMPSLDTVLQAVASTREKFRPKILKARKEAEK
jgi:hypothetical protein